jgi:hypothetical protein
VTIVNLVLVVPFTFMLALVASIGPDSCAESSCHGAGGLARTFLILAVVAAVAPLGSWLTMRPDRRPVQITLAVVAVVGPLLADLIGVSFAPDWF